MLLNVPRNSARRQRMSDQPSEGSRAGTHDAFLLDLDGTLYRGSEVVGDAPAVVAALRRDGGSVRFVTNNAAGTAGEVVTRLRRAGFAAEYEEVYTSSYAAARVLRDRLPAESRVLVLGTAALADQVRDVGLLPVREADAVVAAVVQGHSRDTGWRDLARACVAIRSGAWWVACNTDATLPSEQGELPGNGAMVAALRTATGVEPAVAGKPATSLLTLAAAAATAENPLVVGDRLETDIAGAHAARMDSLLVLSGVSTPLGVLGADERHRPRYIAADVGALAGPLGELEVADPGATDTGWRVEVADDVSDPVLVVSSTGRAAAALALLRRLCPVAWSTGMVTTRAADEGARSALTELGLAT